MDVAGLGRYPVQPASSMPASSSVPGSTPAAGSDAPIWARGCSPPTIRPRRARLAEELHALNAERKSVEARIVEEAVAAIEAGANFDPAAPAIVVAEEDWHPGVVGIVASRLRERYRRPVVVIGLDRAADIGKGSGRSQPGVNLGRAVQAAFHEAGLLLSAGGGHAMAAGLSLRPSVIPEFPRVPAASACPPRWWSPRRRGCAGAGRPGRRPAGSWRTAALRGVPSALVAVRPR